MLDKRIVLVLFMLIVVAATLPTLSATDVVNSTDELATDDGMPSFETMDSGFDDSVDSPLGASNAIYFNASAASNGDGSKSSPFKYVNSNTLPNSGNGLTAYFADGVYSINANFKISSNVVLIGQSRDYTIFNSVSSSGYDFEVMQNANLKLNNLTLNRVNVLNRGTLEADNAVFKNGNVPSANGGVIVSSGIKSSPAEIYLNNCIFDSNLAYSGGSISSVNSNIIIKSSKFSNSKSKRFGGVIYATGSNVFVDDSVFDSNSAGYGGVIYCEKSSVDLRNSNVTDSDAYSFGGAIASKYSQINVTSSSFKDYNSSTDAGGAIYNFKGSLNVFNSSFIGGYSEFGGAIAILESSLTVFSSEFINNTADSYGGAIYNIYGSINLNNSFFNNSNAFAGGAIYSRISDTLIFTNNVFINSTAEEGYNICIDDSNDNVVESGNHFENVFRAYVEYVGDVNGEDFTIKSRVLTYVMSNDGKYFNTYDFGVSSGGYSDYAVLYLWDSNHPQNTTIFGNYSRPLVEFNITNVSNGVRFDFINFYLYDDTGNVVYHWEELMYGLYLRIYKQLNVPFERTIVRSTNLYDLALSMYPNSLIESTPSGSGNIPASYDSRDYGYVTPVKNQAEGGNCWAFSGIATLETCIKKITGIDYDFSEENAKNLMAAYSVLGLDIDTNSYGYDFMLMGYLTSWLGPIKEGEDLYDDMSSLSCVYENDNFHVQNIKFLLPTNHDMIKKAIMDYGAVSVIIFWPGKEHHVVSLVGWKDSYKAKDSLGYSANGAWIFKNSWGKEWGDNGFGYLSYDVNFKGMPYTFVFNENDAYISNYQYDYAGPNDYLVSEDSHIFYANKFTSEGHGDIEYLAAFSTYFIVPTNYTAFVFLNDEMVLSQSGCSDSGYCTIPLSKIITVKEDDEFTIIIENCNEGDNYVPVCQADELTIGNFKKGVSFVSLDGQNWHDLHNLNYRQEFLNGGYKSNTCQVACIKAFTTMKNVLYGTYLNVSEFKSINLNEKVRINVTLEIGGYNIDDSVIEGSLVTFTVGDEKYYAQVHNNSAFLDISFDKAGSTIMFVQYKNNRFASEVYGFDFIVNKKNTVVSANAVSKVYGGSEKSTITLKDDSGNRIANAWVLFNVNGKTTRVKTNVAGQATVPITLAPKTYTATVSFTGTGNYNGASKKVTLVVKKATPRLAALKKTFKVKTKVKLYSVTLKNNMGKAMGNAKVTVKVNGRTFVGKTNARGIATFKITNLKKKGTFRATVRYAGSAYYNPVARNVVLTVR